MNIPLFSFVRHSIDSLGQPVKRRLRQWTKPDNHTLVFNTVLYDTVQGAAVDLTRSKPALVMENALLRQQLVVLQRQTKRLTLTWRDRAGPPHFSTFSPSTPWMACATRRLFASTSGPQPSTESLRLASSCRRRVITLS